MLQRIASVVALVTAMHGVSATVTAFPPLSLYCGGGGFSATALSGTDNRGSFAVNGNFVVRNYGVGAGLAPAPFGTAAVPSLSECMGSSHSSFPLSLTACVGTVTM
jgi:hypothetical protein